MTVIDVEPLGSHTLAIGTVGDSKFTAQFNSKTAVKPEQQVGVSFDEERLHFFKKSDGRAVR
ncbi:MAG: TOBE domain-containing protein [Sneathiellales bacterium]|nr:TOBE domain-containing protein [Sneathiellales bacterium]